MAPTPPSAPKGSATPNQGYNYPVSSQKNQNGTFTPYAPAAAWYPGAPDVPFASPPSFASFPTYPIPQPPPPSTAVPPFHYTQPLQAPAVPPPDQTIAPQAYVRPLLRGDANAVETAKKILAVFLREGIGYEQLVKEGLDPSELRRFYGMMGVEIETSSGSNDQVRPTVSDVVAPEPVLSRSEYLAQLKAAKNKASKVPVVAQSAPKAPSLEEKSAAARAAQELLRARALESMSAKSTKKIDPPADDMSSAAAAAAAVVTDEQAESADNPSSLLQPINAPYLPGLSLAGPINAASGPSDPSTPNNESTSRSTPIPSASKQPRTSFGSSRYQWDAHKVVIADSGDEDSESDLEAAAQAKAQELVDIKERLRRREAELKQLLMKNRSSHSNTPSNSQPQASVSVAPVPGQLVETPPTAPLQTLQQIPDNVTVHQSPSDTPAAGLVSHTSEAEAEAEADTEPKDVAGSRSESDSEMSLSSGSSRGWYASPPENQTFTPAQQESERPDESDSPSDASMDMSESDEDEDEDGDGEEEISDDLYDPPASKFPSSAMQPPAPPKAVAFTEQQADLSDDIYDDEHEEEEDDEDYEPAEIPQQHTLQPADLPVQTTNTVAFPFFTGTTDNSIPIERPTATEDNTATSKAPPQDVQSTATFQYYKPYSSPLAHFKSYRYHPEYTSKVSGGYRSITYSHNIDPNRELCPYETAGGICNNPRCDKQHFRSMTITDDKLVEQMVRSNPGRTDAERAAYSDSLRAAIIESRAHDADTVAAIISQHRRHFVENPPLIPLPDQAVVQSQPDPELLPEADQAGEEAAAEAPAQAEVEEEEEAEGSEEGEVA